MPESLASQFTLHSLVLFCHSGCLFIWRRWRANLPVFLGGFSSFFRITHVFWNASLIFALCTANHPSAFCHRGKAKVYDCWGWRKEENILSVNLVAVSMIACSVLSISFRSGSPVLAVNLFKPQTHQLQCISWRLLVCHPLLCCLFPFWRVFNKFSTSTKQCSLYQKKHFWCSETHRC